MDAKLTHDAFYFNAALGLGGFVLACLAGIHLLWTFYVVVMGLRERRDTGGLTKMDWTFGLPALLVGYALDVIGNWILMTLLLWEWPKELTISDRTLRHARDWMRYSAFPKDYIQPTRRKVWQWRVSMWILSEISRYDKSGGHTAKLEE